MVKLCERHHPDVKATEYPETYFRGQNLTGASLDRNQPFLITRLSTAEASGVFTLHEPAVAHHRSIIPADLSVMYAKFESGHRDFIIRLSSRATAISPYFSNLDLALLARLCRRFGYRSNEFATQRNLTMISELFQLSISDFSRYYNVIDKFSEIYERVFPNPIILLAKGKGSRTLNHLYCKDDSLVRLAGSVPADSVTKLSRSIANDASIMLAGSFNKMLGVELVAEGSNKYIFVIPVNDADVEGILYTGIESDNTARQIALGIKPKNTRRCA